MKAGNDRLAWRGCRGATGPGWTGARGMRRGLAATMAILLAGCVGAGATDVTTRTTDGSEGDVISVSGVAYAVSYRPDMLWMEQARDASGHLLTDADGRAELIRRVTDVPTPGLRVVRADAAPLRAEDEATVRAVAAAYCAAHPDLSLPARFGQSLIFSEGAWIVLEVCG